MTRRLRWTLCFLILGAHVAAAQDTIVVPLERLEVTITRVSQPLTRVPAPDSSTQPAPSTSKYGV